MSPSPDISEQLCVLRQGVNSLSSPREEGKIAPSTGSCCKTETRGWLAQQVSSSMGPGEQEKETKQVSYLQPPGGTWTPATLLQLPPPLTPS